LLDAARFDNRRLLLPLDRLTDFMQSVYARTNFFTVAVKHRHLPVPVPAPLVFAEGRFATLVQLSSGRLCQRLFESNRTKPPLGVHPSERCFSLRPSG